MATLEDVARKAQVSSMTVSRVLNGAGLVSPKTRQRVMEAVEELGYRTNMLARGLVTGRSNIIAYIVPDVSDPYFNVVFKSAETVCRENGVMAVFLSAENNTALSFVLQMSIEHKFDGVIMHDLNPDDEMFALLEHNHIPCVLVDNERIVRHVATLDIDHASAAEQVADIFARQGYETIYCVHGPLTDTVDLPPDAPRRLSQRRIWRERSAGFAWGLARHGLTPRMLLADRFEEGNGYLSSLSAAKQILEEKRWPAAVYCEDDVLALGVSGYMQERGVLLPDQLAIIGNDGLEMSTTLYPRVSCILHPRALIGRRANEMLLAIIHGSAPVTHEYAEVQMFWGDTTRSPETETE